MPGGDSLHCFLYSQRSGEFINKAINYAHLIAADAWKVADHKFTDRKDEIGDWPGASMTWSEAVGIVARSDGMRISLRSEEMTVRQQLPRASEQPHPESFHLHEEWRPP
jgi:Ni,Fe-hydrogenase III large subunit